MECSSNVSPRPSMSVLLALPCSSLLAQTRTSLAEIRTSLAQIGAADVGILSQLGCAARERDGARLQHVAAVGDLERHRRVLLDEENGRALTVDVLDRREDLLDEHRRQAHARLVEEQHARAG